MELNKERQTVTHETVKDHITQHVQRTHKEGHDIAKSTRDLKKVDLLSEKLERLVSQETDADKLKIKQDSPDVDCSMQKKMQLERAHTLDQNLNKVHALTHSNCCDKMMQNRIEEHPDCESKIKDHPVELLKAIKVLMHDQTRAKHLHASLTEAMSRLIDVKQVAGEQRSAGSCKTIQASTRHHEVSCGNKDARRDLRAHARTLKLDKRDREDCHERRSL